MQYLLRLEQSYTSNHPFYCTLYFLLFYEYDLKTCIFMYSFHIFGIVLSGCRFNCSKLFNFSHFQGLIHYTEKDDVEKHPLLSSCLCVLSITANITISIPDIHNQLFLHNELGYAEIKLLQSHVFADKCWYESSF